MIASFLSTPYPLESFEYVMRGIHLADRAGDRSAYAMGMAMLAAYLAGGSVGRFGDRAIATAQRLAIASDAAYPRMVAAGAAGILAALRGNWDAMRIAHAEGRAICTELGMERTWEASFLRLYHALGELYAGEPRACLEVLGDDETSDDVISRAMLRSCRGRAYVLAGNLAPARAIAKELATSPAASRGMAAIYREVFAAELALAERDWPRASAIGDALAQFARVQWLSALPTVSAMIDVVRATAKLRHAPARARDLARALHRRGKVSFYAVTALRLWGQAEARLGNAAAARRCYARARAVAGERGGRVDQLALSALCGERVVAGPLAFAVAWSTGGEVTCLP